MWAFTCWAFGTFGIQQVIFSTVGLFYISITSLTGMMVQLRLQNEVNNTTTRGSIRIVALGMMCSSFNASCRQSHGVGSGGAAHMVPMAVDHI
jgi:hypothetical protein